MLVNRVHLISPSFILVGILFSIMASTLAIAGVQTPQGYSGKKTQLSRILSKDSPFYAHGLTPGDPGYKEMSDMRLQYRLLIIDLSSDKSLMPDERFELFETAILAEKMDREQLNDIERSLDNMKSSKDFKNKYTDLKRLIALKGMTAHDAALACLIAQREQRNSIGGLLKSRFGYNTFLDNLDSILQKQVETETKHAVSEDPGVKAQRTVLADGTIEDKLKYCAAEVGKGITEAKASYASGIQQIMVKGTFVTGAE